MKLKELAILLVAVLLLLALTVKKWTPNPATAKKVFEDWGDLASKYSMFFQIPVEVVLAEICVESEGDPDAVNGKSKGLMQIQPDALTDFNRWYGRSYTVDDLFTPWVNIEVGTGYLKGVQSYYVSSHTIEDAIRAYKEGPKNIGDSVAQQYLSRVQAYRSLMFSF